MDLKDKTAELQKQVGENTMWKQIGYISNDDTDCEPILLSEKHESNVWPIVIEAPDGLVSPKYDWTKHVWVETDANSQGAQIKALKASLDSAKQTIASVQTSAQTTGATLEAIQKSQEQQAATSAQMLQMLAPLLADKSATPTPTAPMEGGNK
jgi:hypothetical protein